MISAEPEKEQRRAIEALAQLCTKQKIRAASPGRSALLPCVSLGCCVPDANC